MKFLVLIAAVLATASAASYKGVLEQEFNLYKVKYNRTYRYLYENFRRFEIFVQNKYEVLQHNLKYERGETTYKMGINEFSDWFPEEFAQINGFNKDLRDRVAAGEHVAFEDLDAELHVMTNKTTPKSVNWVAKGAVTSVKNQGPCGSCYAFSAIAALESQNFIKTKQLVDLSEQQIVDCSGEFGNFGCNGGNSPNTYNYIKTVGGVNTEYSYPYEGYLDKCRHDPDNNGATCSSYVRVKGGEEALKDAVANVGPISVAINVRDRMGRYTGGVYSDPDCRNDMYSLNHAVVVVGYDTDPYTKQDYWLVKNSWSTAWGEDGYIRIARNQNNMCGIATYAIYPRI